MITEEHHNLLSTSLGIGREVLDIEIAALENLRDRLNETVLKAVRIILNSRGKVITTGVGKSGFVAQKITAMLNSTGSPSVFLHPTEALHGDLGICAREDPVIMVSKSGTTEELLRLLPFFNEMGSPIIALVGNKYSYLAENSEVVLDVSVEREADPLALVPTTSCILAMAMGDVLASLLIKAKNYLSKDFARVHPAGQLGKNLHLTVE